ncbi:MAG: hypothetical protein OEX19_07245 [Gammaproteobacteria bacterium]|nr:hypothetical protein [Gammaproteobacteria bacterium]
MLWVTKSIYISTYLHIYSMLAEGRYGEAHCLDEEYDNNGNITQSGTEYEAEISQHSTKSGHAEVFYWESK